MDLIKDYGQGEIFLQIIIFEFNYVKATFNLIYTLQREKYGLHVQ